MSCKPYIELIHKAWTGSLSSAESETLAAHVATCAACAKQADVVRLVSQAAARESLPEVPHGLRDSVMAAVYADAESAPERAWWQWFSTLPLTARLAGAAACVALALLGGVLGAEMASDPTATRPQTAAAPTHAPGSQTSPAHAVDGEDWAASFDAEAQDLPLGWYLASESPVERAPGANQPGAAREEI